MLAGLASRTVMDNVAIVVSAQKMPSIRHLFASFSSVFCRDPDLFSQKTRKPCGQAFRLKPRPLGLSRSCRLCKLFKTCLIYRCTRSLEPTSFRTPLKRRIITLLTVVSSRFVCVLGVLLGPLFIGG